MVDISASIQRVRGMIVEPDNTLVQHLDPVPPWGVVAREHVLPLLIMTSLVTLVLFLVFLPLYDQAGAPLPGPAALAVQAVVRVPVNLLILAVLAGVLAVISGMAGGLRDFNAAFAVTCLSLTPLLVAEALLPIPLLGPIIAIIGLVRGLVILYRGITPALRVAPSQRPGVFFGSVAASFMILVIAIAMLGPLLVPIAR